MKTILPFFVFLLGFMSLSAQDMRVPRGFEVRPKKTKTPLDIAAEFVRALGADTPASTTDVNRAVLYITSDKENVELFATTNFRLDSSEYLPRLVTLGGLLDSNELRALFHGTAEAFSVTEMPLWIDNEVFSTFATLNALRTYRNVSIVSKAGTHLPFRHSMAELKPRFYAQVSINLENLNKFLFERSYPPESIRVLSLLNNTEVNAAFSKVFPHFQTIRTVDQVEKTIGSAAENVIFVIGQIQENQLLRYRLEGPLSYALPIRQFQGMAVDLKKEIVLIGCNYADNLDLKPPKGVLNVEEEVNVLAEALKQTQFGPMLYALGKNGQDSIVVSMASSTDYKNATIERNAGGKSTSAYNFIFFDTHPRPTLVARAPRLLFQFAGVFFLGFALFQSLCYWVFYGRWVFVMKWINWGLMLFFAMCFLLSPLIPA